MDCVGFESYILKEEELKLLLAGLGVRQIYGLLSADQTEKIEKDILNRTMVELYQNKIVNFTDGKIEICPEFAEIFTVLTESRNCITIHSIQPDAPVKCCYASDGKVVMMEKCHTAQDRLNVSVWLQKQWFCFMNEWMSGMVSEYDQEFQKMDQINEGAVKWLEDHENYMGDKQTIAVFSIQSCRKKKVFQRILIREKGLATYIIVQQPERSLCKPYGKDELMRVMHAWMEDKDDTGRYLYSDD